MAPTGKARILEREHLCKTWHMIGGSFLSLLLIASSLLLLLFFIILRDKLTPRQTSIKSWEPGYPTHFVADRHQHAHFEIRSDVSLTTKNLLDLKFILSYISNIMNY